MIVMFIVSGVSKIGNFGKTVGNFRGKIEMNESIVEMIIMCVIVLEIFAPLVIIYYYIYGEYKEYAYYGVMGLIIFTVLATLMYHPLDVSSYYKSIPFWANISLIGGLLLLGDDIMKK